MALGSISLTRSLLFFLLFLPLLSSGRHSELDETVAKVECLECVVTWSSSSQYSLAPKCGHPRMCSGTACFMRQCKHCPVYQYMMGCLSLSRWQTEDIEFAKKEVEQRVSRVGAVLLCEDSFNQTTCICNRRDKCNSLHHNLPHSTYAEGFFSGIINFDVIIGRIDPNYFSIIPGSHRQSPHLLTSSSFVSTFSLLYIALLVIW
ncbi:hypothetical protein PMAYCL1PPCAC_06594 [Pristionchus mayeri]|uniref:RING-type domain-containing protein n=1 Tax=Pristionchus mayeri TaxID=1317129 RepID=A0AAN4ZAI9_9BILA|nr:hypothetical protein PMAYCL1PPCAC_06594 [Pristionchus mayeri]